MFGFVPPLVPGVARVSLTELMAIVSLVVLAAASVDIVFQLRSIRHILELEFRNSADSSRHAGPVVMKGLGKRRERSTPSMPGSSKEDGANINWARSGYVVWSYRAGDWSIVESRCNEGFNAGPKPARPGRFENEHIRTPGVKLVAR